MRSSSNCIFHVYGEQTPLNRLLSFFSTSNELADVIIVQNFISIAQGVTVERGSKNRMFPYESGVVHNTALHCRARCDLVFPFSRLMYYTSG
jgi:hypothetical protein